MSHGKGPVPRTSESYTNIYRKMGVTVNSFRRPSFFLVFQLFCVVAATNHASCNSPGDCTLSTLQKSTNVFTLMLGISMCDLPGRGVQSTAVSRFREQAEQGDYRMVPRKTRVDKISIGDIGSDENTSALAARKKEETHRCCCGAKPEVVVEEGPEACSRHHDESECDDAGEEQGRINNSEKRACLEEAADTATETWQWASGGKGSSVELPRSGQKHDRVAQNWHRRTIADVGESLSGIERRNVSPFIGETVVSTGDERFGSWSSNREATPSPLPSPPAPMRPTSKSSRTAASSRQCPLSLPRQASRCLSHYPASTRTPLRLCTKERWRACESTAERRRKDLTTLQEVSVDEGDLCCDHESSGGPIDNDDTGGDGMHGAPPSTKYLCPSKQAALRDPTVEDDDPPLRWCGGTPRRDDGVPDREEAVAVVPFSDDVLQDLPPRCLSLPLGIEGLVRNESAPMIAVDGCNCSPSLNGISRADGTAQRRRPEPCSHNNRKRHSPSAGNSSTSTTINSPSVAKDSENRAYVASGTDGDNNGSCSADSAVGRTIIQQLPHSEGLSPSLDAEAAASQSTYEPLTEAIEPSAQYSPAEIVHVGSALEKGEESDNGEQVEGDALGRVKPTVDNAPCSLVSDSSSGAVSEACGEESFGDDGERHSVHDCRQHLVAERSIAEETAAPRGEGKPQSCGRGIEPSTIPSRLLGCDEASPPSERRAHDASAVADAICIDKLPPSRAQCRGSHGGKGLIGEALSETSVPSRHGSSSATAEATASVKARRLSSSVSCPSLPSKRAPSTVWSPERLATPEPFAKTDATLAQEAVGAQQRHILQNCDLLSLADCSSEACGACRAPRGSACGTSKLYPTGGGGQTAEHQGRYEDGGVPIAERATGNMVCHPSVVATTETVVPVAEQQHDHVAGGRRRVGSTGDSATALRLPREKDHNGEAPRAAKEMSNRATSPGGVRDAGAAWWATAGHCGDDSCRRPRAVAFTTVIRRERKCSGVGVGSLGGALREEAKERGNSGPDTVCGRVEPQSTGKAVALRHGERLFTSNRNSSSGGAGGMRHHCISRVGAKGGHRLAKPCSSDDELGDGSSSSSSNGALMPRTLTLPPDLLTPRLGEPAGGTATGAARLVGLMGSIITSNARRAITTAAFGNPLLETWGVLNPLFGMPSGPFSWRNRQMIRP